MARVGLTGERLARAGAELADEVGFEHVTVSALARRFGVQVASLYSHVRNSDDLKTRIATVTLTELADQAANAVAGRAGQDALTALANTYRTYAHQHPGRYTASRHTPPNPHPTPPTASAHPTAPADAPFAATPTSAPTAGARTSASTGAPTGGVRGLGSGRAGGGASGAGLGTEYVAAGRRHSELMRAVLRGYDLDEPAQTDAVRLLGSVIHGYAALELAGTFSYSAPTSDDSWPRILDALDSLLRNWPERHAK